MVYVWEEADYERLLIVPTPASIFYTLFCVATSSLKGEYVLAVNIIVLLGVVVHGC